MMKAEAKAVRYAHFARAAGTHERLERRQHLLRLALARLETLVEPFGEFDDSFCAAFRECLLAVGATAADIDAIAEFNAGVVVEGMVDRSTRDEELGAIAEHLACTSMKFEIAEFADGGAVLMRVDFPDRPKLQ